MVRGSPPGAFDSHVSIRKESPFETRIPRDLPELSRCQYFFRQYLSLRIGCLRITVSRSVLPAPWLHVLDRDIERSVWLT